MLDVLKRYLLIVWNFFFGQTSSESIQDSPKDRPEDSVDTVPPVGVDGNDDVVVNEDDDEIYEDEEDEEFEGEEEEELEDEDEDENDEVIVPEKPQKHEKPEDKIVIPTTPSGGSADKTEKVKVPEVPKANDDVVKNPEPPKVNDVVEVEEKGKQPKPEERDNVEVKKPETPKSKPGFEAVEKEVDARATIPGKEGVKEAQSEFEIVEREPSGGVTKDASGPKSEFEFVERETTAVKPKSAVGPKPGVEGQSVKPAGVVDEDAAVSTGHEDKRPEKIQSRVKFEDEIRGNPNGGKTAPPPSSGKLVDVNVPPKVNAGGAGDFVVMEKGGTAEKKADDVVPKKTEDNPIDSFLLGEQVHSRLQLHPESIQDQQLDYSDSCEELSDDDIEIDYVDDEDDEVDEEVKPLPPVVRSVYKKNN